VGQTQLHALLSTTFNSFHRQVDIVLTKNRICTLANVVIIDPTHADLFSQFYPIQRFATFDATQAKEMSHHNQRPTNQFLLLAIEVFECLHKQIDVFLHDCVNVIWSLKRPKGPPFSILVTFLC